MERRSGYCLSVIMLVFGVVFLHCLVMTSFAANVTYDHRALVVDGKRRVLISGSIHYPRSTPDMWPDLIQKSKDGGLDVIETYVFWNLHEPVRNQYDFEGRKDLINFVKLVEKAGLFVHIRIGPYVCAEWNYGGFPLWLHFIPGIEFRTDNEPFKAEMKRFTAKIVDMIKQENLYASQGGPVILSQIENEYGNGDIESRYGPRAKPYVNWAASMATSLNTGVPWVMCQQPDAPPSVINTCNGFYCDQFKQNSDKTPKMWTENWTGWFLSFGGPVPYRPVEDIAFAVARFFQRGGTFQNYYMYHGGTNFGRTSGGPFIATSYDYDAPLDEYGLINQPKWGHLKDLHKAIKLCEAAMVATEPNITSLGSNIEVSVYKTDSQCAAFLANTATQSDAAVSFNGNSYHLPPWSVSILPDCKNVAFSTAKINSASTISTFVTRSSEADAAGGSLSGWTSVNEPVGISNENAFTRMGLLEQINTTADKSDYLWYSLSVNIKNDEPFLQDGSATVLHVKTLGHVLHAYINGKLSGSGKGNSGHSNFTIEVPVTLVPGENKIDLLSATVGLQNYGAFFDLKGAGITGPVQLKGFKNGSTTDLSSKQWTYQVGLKGEDLSLSNGGSTLWKSQTALPTNQPLIWYKGLSEAASLPPKVGVTSTYTVSYPDPTCEFYAGLRIKELGILFMTGGLASFDAPAGDTPLSMDFTGMGKGEAWVNGQSIGRFWPAYTAPNNGCTDPCNYRGGYSAEKCLKNCGKPSQLLYQVPRSWLKSSGNVLVLFEEMGGDPTKLSFATREIQSVCSRISDAHPLPIDMWASEDDARKQSGPTLSLECPHPNQVISSIKFASFGTPQGTCGSFIHGRCSSSNALSIVKKACIGSKSCSLGVSINVFGDPCKGVAKSLAVEASCT